MAVRLTDKFIENVKGAEARKEYMDALVPGLALVVQPSGKRSWAVRYRMAGRPTKLTLGPHPLLSLGEAREQAREVLQKVAKGEDVAAEKRTTKTITFTDAPSRERDLWPKVLERYLIRDAASLRSHNAIKATLERETKERWASKLVRDIRRRDIVAMLDEIADRGAPIAANRALAYTRRVFNWAKSRDLVDANPCDGVRGEPEKSRDRVLCRAELTDIWNVATGLAYPFGTMVHLLILTAQRLREIAEMPWAELDLDAGTWVVEPARAKNASRHQVALAPSAVEIIKGVPKLGRPPRYLLTTTGDTPISGFSRAKKQFDRKLRELDLERAKSAGLSADQIEPRAPWTFHDLRRSAATGMAELGILPDLIERILNHAGPTRSGIRGTYNRFEFLNERRAALHRWADEVARFTAPTPAAPAENARHLRVV